MSKQVQTIFVDSNANALRLDWGQNVTSMSLFASEEVQNNSAKSFLTALGINAAVLTLEVGAFILLKNRFARIYSPRTFLPPPSKRADKLPDGPWKWIPAVLLSPSEDIIRKNGLDAYMFVRFLRMLFQIFLFFMVVTWPIIIPVNAVNMPEGNRDGLARLSWGNIDPTAQSRYWAHLIVAYILTAFVLWRVRYELSHFVHLRHQFLITRSHARLAQAKTVLITSLPKELSNEKDLDQFFSFVPGGVRRVWIYRNSPDLPDLYDARLKACNMLEKAACSLLQKVVKGSHQKSSMDTSGPLAVHVRTADAAQLQDPEVARDPLKILDVLPRPQHRLGILPFMSQKVDTIDWCKTEIVRLTAEINKARSTLHQCEPHGSAFVQCNLQMGAHVLAQCVSYHEPLMMANKWIEVAPEDIVWANIDGAYEVRARFVISWIITLTLTGLWGFPAAFIGLLSNVDQLCTRIHWLEWVCETSPIVQGLIQGVAPPILLAVQLVIFPYILQALAWYECIPRYSLISVSVYRRYFLFLIIHGFLIITVSSGLTSAIPQMLRRPGTIVESLATRLPDASIFFLTYVITQGLAGAGGALLQIAPLVLYFVKRWFLGNTPRQAYVATFLMPMVDFGVSLPRMSLLAAIGITYSVVSPLINGLAAIAFGLFFISWKFLFTWVLDQPDHLETGGLYFPMLINNIFTGLYIEQLCLAGLFFLATDDKGGRSSIPQGVFMVILTAITLCAQVLYDTSYDPITKYLPMSLATSRMARKFEKERQRQGTVDGEASGFDLFSRDHIKSVVKQKLRQKIGRKVSAIKKAKGKANGAQRPPAIITPTDSQTPEAPVSNHKSKPSKASIAIEELMESAGSSIPIAPAAPAQKSEIKDHESHRHHIQHPAGWADDDDDDDSDTDDDLEDHAFDHPSTWVDTPWIWIPKDEYGVSDILVKEIRDAGVDASNKGAEINEYGLVEVTRNPPDEEWLGGQNI